MYTVAARTLARRALPRIAAPMARRTFLTLESVKYTANATATGGGRNGKAGLDDGSLDVKMTPPKEMGGSGEGHNPEQLFAIGYSACFLGAFRLAASKAHIKLPESTTVSSHVHIGPHGGGFALAVDLEIKVPGLEGESEKVEAAVKKAHEEICPYSNATRGNVEVTLSVKYD